MATEQRPAPHRSRIAVFSRDGRHLGHIARIDADRGVFKVDAPLRPDFWLEFDYVQEVHPNYLLLNIPEVEVRRRKTEGGLPRPDRTRAR